MESALVLAVTLLFGLAVGILAVAWPRRHPARVRRVLVNFTAPDADAVRGVLLRQSGEWLVLASAELLRADGASLRLDGEVVLERRAVLFLQVLP